MGTKTITYYNKKAKELSVAYGQIDFGLIQEQVAAFFSSSNKILELGSGSGRDANFLIEEGYDVIGIDGSPEMIKESIKQYPALRDRVILCDLAIDYPKFEFQFDALYSIATLIHFNKEELERVLLNSINVLQDNAPVFISVSLKRELIQDDDRFFNGLSKEEWGGLFENCGFKTEKIVENRDSSGRNITWCSFYLRKV